MMVYFFKRRPEFFWQYAEFEESQGNFDIAKTMLGKVSGELFKGHLPSLLRYAYFENRHSGLQSALNVINQALLTGIGTGAISTSAAAAAAVAVGTTGITSEQQQQLLCFFIKMSFLTHVEEYDKVREMFRHYMTPPPPTTESGPGLEGLTVSSLLSSSSINYGPLLSSSAFFMKSYQVWNAYLDFEIQYQSDGSILLDEFEEALQKIEPLKDRRLIGQKYLDFLVASISVVNNNKIVGNSPSPLKGKNNNIVDLVVKKNLLHLKGTSPPPPPATSENINADVSTTGDNDGTSDRKDNPVIDGDGADGADGVGDSDGKNVLNGKQKKKITKMTSIQVIRHMQYRLSKLQ